MDLQNLDKMKVVDLRNELISRGLDKGGVKAVLIERLRASLEGGSGGVPPSPGTPCTPGRRSRRTRSMTKSPSPSPVKKAPEPTLLETLEEESNSSNAVIEEEEKEENFSTPVKSKVKSQETSPSEEDLHEEENSESAEEEAEEEKLSTPVKLKVKSQETSPSEEETKSEDENSECVDNKVHVEDCQEEQTNGGEATVPASNDAEISTSVFESYETVQDVEKDVQGNIYINEAKTQLDNVEKSKDQEDKKDSSPKISKSLKDNVEKSEDQEDKKDSSPKISKSLKDNVEKSEDQEDKNDSSPKISKSSLKERSRSHSTDRRERSNRSHSRSRSISRSPRHKLRSRSRSRSHSRSRTHSRSPKRRSGAASLGSPTKEGEDSSTPEDEPTIEENQFGLSWFDSDLHLRIDPVTFTSAKPMSHDIYALVWSGARTNYGVREGKVCFEVRLSEETNLSRDNPFRDEPCTKGFRVGFSMPTSNLLLGESENSFAYCESGRKATNGEFVDFAKPFHLDDVIGCYLDLDATPCTIKYTLNGEDLGVAFEFDKAILDDNQALFSHVLTKGFEYEINLADNDNLLVNVERKIRKRRKIKKIEEKKEKKEKEKQDDKKISKTSDEEKNVEGSGEEITEDATNDTQMQQNSETQEQKDEVAKPEEEDVKEDANKKQEDIEMCENPKEETETTNIIEEGDAKANDDKQKTEDTPVTKTVDSENVEKENKNNEEKPTKDKDNYGPSPSKRQKVDNTEEDEYEEIHPVPREHMSLLLEYELIALIPEEQYITGPKRPESRKECEVILMVGLPGAGKSTWVLNHINKNPEKRYHVIGADALITKMTIDGSSRKSVHKGRFDRVYELCFNALSSLEDIAVKRRRNFILDQANAYASAQRRKMKGFADFKRIAVVCIPNEEELKRRLADKKEKGHAYTLKEATLNTLQATFTLPSLEFGWFDDIIFTDLCVDEAKEEVKKYNEKGKKALDENHSNRDKRQRRENYRNDNRRRQDDRRRYDNHNDNRWNDRRAGGGGGGGGYYHGGAGGGGNRWGGRGGYRNNSDGYRDDRGYGGGGNRGYDHRQQRFSGGPQNWVHNNRDRYNDRSSRYSSGGGGGGSGRYDSYGGGGGGGGSSRDYRSGGGDHRDYRDRNRGDNGDGAGGAGNNRRDSQRSGGSSNQRDFRHGHRDTREDSRGGSIATSSTATVTLSKHKSSSVAGGNNGDYDKYTKNQQPHANNWSQYQHHQVGSVNPHQQQYWNYDMQGYGNQQQWQSMDPQQQQQWMAWWQQQGGAQQAAGGGTSDPNQYWSQYSYNTSTDVPKK